MKPSSGSWKTIPTITVPANSSNDYKMQNDEWSVKVSIDKIDSETKQCIKGDAEFKIFAWDTVRQCYIPNGGYNQYKVERQSNGTYKVINHSNYANGSDNIYYTQRNEGKFVIVESRAPSGYYGDWTDVTNPGTAGSVLGKRAYAFEITKALDGQTIWLGNADYNADISTTNSGGTLIDTSEGSVDISKQDITNGKELPGAKLEIRDTDGNLVEGWTSTKTPHTVRGLELEKAYTLTETRAPDGYTEAESIVFKLVQEGNEQSNIVYVKSGDDWVKLDDATVIMQDAPVLDIDKTDIAGNLLPGATLTIRDANDEVVDTWTTDYKTHSVPISDEFIKLSDGNKEYIYTLTEDAAPAGFEIAESVQFKVQQADENVCLFVRENADAEWTRADKRLIQMIDEATPREETPAPTPVPTPQPIPAAKCLKSSLFLHVTASRPTHEKS